MNLPEELSTGELTGRIRSFFMDSQIPEAYHISTIMGCTDISDDAADMEEAASDARVTRIDHLIPLLFAYAKSMAEGVVKHQQAHLDEEALAEADPEVWVATEKMFTEITMNTLVGAVSQMVDMGFLVIKSEQKKSWWNRG